MIAKNSIKERPILFSAEMVRAILEGRKTQTRRVIKPHPILPQGFSEIRWFTAIKTETNGIKHHPPIQISNLWYASTEPYGFLDKENKIPESKLIGTWKCPYGKQGDKLWVKESHQYLWKEGVKSVYDINDKTGEELKVFYLATDDRQEFYDEVEEKLSDKIRSSIHMHTWASRITLEIKNIRVERVQDISEEEAIAEGMQWLLAKNQYATEKKTFEKYWNSINEKRGFDWKANPWVWVIEFRRVK